jgi:hypothetical protein
MMWPGAVYALVVLPPTRPGGHVVLYALAAAAVGVGSILRLINWERRNEGAPRTRLGVIGRFLFFGFVFSVLAEILAVFAQAVLALFGPHGFSQNVAESTSSLELGFAGLIFAALVGVSWSLWAGLAACVIAFEPRAESMRLRGFDLQRVGDLEPEPAPRPKPRRPTPRPETEVEAALRPEWD